MRALIFLLAMIGVASAQPVAIPQAKQPQLIGGTIPGDCCSPNQVHVLNEIRNLINEGPEDMDVMASFAPLADAAVTEDRGAYAYWTQHFQSEITRLGLAGDKPTTRLIVRGIAHAHCRPLVSAKPLKYACQMLGTANIRKP